VKAERWSTALYVAQPPSGLRPLRPPKRNSVAREGGSLGEVDSAAGTRGRGAAAGEVGAGDRGFDVMALPDVGDDGADGEEWQAGPVGDEEAFERGQVICVSHWSVRGWRSVVDECGLVLQRDFSLRLGDRANAVVNMGKRAGFKRMYESGLDSDCLCGVTTTVLLLTVRKVSL